MKQRQGDPIGKITPAVLLLKIMFRRERNYTTPEIAVSLALKQMGTLVVIDQSKCAKKTRRQKRGKKKGEKNLKKTDCRDVIWHQ